MATTSLASRSTLRLSEVARHVVIPEGIVDSEWPRVEERIADMAVVFDRWQTNLGELILGLTADGKYAATVGGVTLSIPRQVGKTFTIGVLIIALCIEFPGLLVLWTAHHGRTTTKTFRSIQGIVKRKRVAPHLAAGGGIRTANGEQEIAFANGSLIMFGAREHGFGRGMDGVDIEVFDEAQILGDKALEDMVAATNQSRHEHGALLIYMGTPPRPEDNGEAFTAKRRKALDGKTKNAVYVECSADRGASPDDRAQWAIANPSFPHHTPVESMERMRENLPSDASWMLEAYGIWNEIEAVRQVIPPDTWNDLVTDTVAGEPSAFAIDMSHDRLVSIGVCVKGDEVDHVELAAFDHADTEQSVIAWLVERAGRKIPVVIDSYSPAASLVPELEKARVKVKVVSSGGDMAKACGAFYDAATTARLSHFGQQQVDEALRGAKKRNVGTAGGWAWDRKDGSINLAPLVAVTLAKYGADNFARRQRSGGSYQH